MPAAKQITLSAEQRGEVGTRPEVNEALFRKTGISIENIDK